MDAGSATSMAVRPPQTSPMRFSDTMFIGQPGMGTKTPIRELLPYVVVYQIFRKG